MRTLPPVFDHTGRTIFMRLVINGVLQAASVVGTMLLVRHAFDHMIMPAADKVPSTFFNLQGTAAIFFVTSALLMCTGFAAALRLVELTDAERLGQGYIHRVRMTLFNQMAKFPPRVIGKWGTGVIMLRFVGDLNALRIWVSRGLARIVVSTIVVTLSTGVLASVDTTLAGASLAIMLLGLTGNLLLGPRMQRAVNESRRIRGRLASNINEKIRVFTVILAFNQIGRERRKFRNQSRHLRNSIVARTQVTGSMRIVTEVSSVISMTLLLAVGTFEVRQGMTTPGNVIGAMAVVGFISNAFKDFGRVHEYLQNARVSKQKLVTFLRTRTMRGRASDLPSLTVSHGTIRFENVCSAMALADISATIPGGSRVILTGPNGAGKSTFIQAAARLIDIDSGRILIDDQDTAQCNLASVRDAIGIVSPDLPLLRGSVRFNLCYRRPDATENDISWAMYMSGLDTSIDAIPAGLQFRLQEGGLNLSLGQRHQLALARAVLGRPPLLFIDEIDANLDHQANAAITRILTDYPGTVIMVTRSEQRINQGDLCLHLDGGRLTQTCGQQDAIIPDAHGNEHRTDHEQ